MKKYIETWYNDGKTQMLGSDGTVVLKEGIGSVALKNAINNHIQRLKSLSVIKPSLKNGIIILKVTDGKGNVYQTKTIDLSNKYAKSGSIKSKNMKNELSNYQQGGKIMRTKSEITESLEKAKRQVNAANRIGNEKIIAKAKSEVAKYEKELAEFKEEKAKPEKKAEKIKSVKGKKGKGKKAEPKKKPSEKAKLTPDEPTNFEECMVLLKEAKQKAKKVKQYREKVKKHPVTITDTVEKTAKVLESKTEDKTVSKTQAKAIIPEIKEIVKTIRESMKTLEDGKKFVRLLIVELKKLL